LIKVACDERDGFGYIVGRGNREGAQLFREWFNKLDQTAEQGGLAAYVFVMGSMAGLLRCSTCQ
jgi:hypothetical protein